MENINRNDSGDKMLSIGISCLCAFKYIKIHFIDLIMPLRTGFYICAIFYLYFKFVLSITNPKEY